MLSADRRRALHNAALLAGEQLYANRLGEKADWLAFHAFRAQAWGSAVTHLKAAAAREIGRAANRVAVQHLETALVAIDRLSVEERAPLAIDVRIALRHALTPLGRVQQTLDCLSAARVLATELDDQIRLGRVFSFTANCLVLQARYMEALTTGERALDVARELGDFRLELATSMYMARARQARGEYCVAIEMFEGILASLPQQACSRGQRKSPAQLNLRPLVAHCHLGFADLYERRGLQAEAATFRNLGQGLLHELGMKRWLKA